MMTMRESMTWCALASAALLLAGCDQSGEANTAPPAAPASEPAPIVGVLPVVGRPPVEFDPPTLDFGLIEPNRPVVGTITVRNTGDRPLKVLTVKPTCKCTTLSDIAGAVIEPGGSVDLVAELEGRDSTGTRKASVRIAFEGYDQALEVDILAEVTFPVRVSPTIFNLAAGDTTGHVVVKSTDGRTFNVLAANRRPPAFVDFDPEFDEPRSEYVLKWDVTQEKADGTLPRWWVIETDHPDCPLVDAWIRDRSTIELPQRGQKWLLNDRRVVLGILEPGQATDFTVRIKDLAGTRIYSVRPLSPDFEARLLSVEPRGADADCTIRVTPSASAKGLVVGRIEFVASEFWARMDVIFKVP